MNVDLSKSPDYERLIETLLKKTEEGKLTWHETAEENTFITSVQGQRSFSVSFPRGLLLPTPGVALTVEDSDGKTLIQTISNAQAAHNLYQLAQRLAMQVDEKLESTVDLLQKL